MTKRSTGDNELSVAQVKDPRSIEKKPYQSPALREYGHLHLLTQGSGTMMNDAASGMRMTT
jgi:hypothetical protein